MKLAVLVVLAVSLQIVASAKEKYSSDRNKKPPVESEVSSDEELSEEGSSPPGKPNTSPRQPKSSGEEQEESKWPAEVAKNLRDVLLRSRKRPEARAPSSGESSEELEDYDDDGDDGDLVLVAGEESAEEEPRRGRAHLHGASSGLAPLPRSAVLAERPGRLGFLRDREVDYEDLEDYAPRYLELRAVPARPARGAVVRLYVRPYPDRDRRWLARRGRDRLLDLLRRRLRRRGGTARGLGDIRRPVAFVDDNYLFSDEIYRLIRKHKHKLPETYYPSYETHPYPQHVQAANYTSYLDEYFKNKTLRAEAAAEAAALAKKENDRAVAPRALFPFST